MLILDQQIQLDEYSFRQEKGGLNLRLFQLFQIQNTP
jgi:hypothetical protein